MSIDIDKLRRKLTDAKAAEVLVFQPNRDQALAKANFWTIQAERGTQVLPNASLETVLGLGAYSGIAEWWDTKGFSEWFLNQDEFRQKLEFLANVSLDHLEKILLDEKTNGNAKVAAVKLIMELAKKMPSKSTEEQFLDEKIAQMDKKELEQFIAARIQVVPTPEAK